MKGFISIPLILGLLLLVIAVPVGVKLTSQNQNIQNRAAYEPVAQLSCIELNNQYFSYCSVGKISASSATVPCTEVKLAISKYCQTSPIPTTVPKITTVPPQPVCSTGSKKCAGRMLFVCKNNNWTINQVCPTTCSNGRCITSKSVSPVPTRSFDY